MTEWSKVLEVFLSGIIGVYLVMFLLQIVTQISLMVIDRLEAWQQRNAEPQPLPEQKVAVAKE